jgi:hypothetical protein
MVIPDNLKEYLQDLAPALLVFLFSTLLAVSIFPLTSATGWFAVYKMVTRLFRLTLFLCLPLYVLRHLYGFVVKRMRRRLLQIDVTPAGGNSRAKYWIIRPFQGIGLGLLFGTNLLRILQVVIGPETADSLVPDGWFRVERFLVSMSIAIFISLLLATLWTLDDLGIRYFNEKDQEMRMVGKYVGTVMPVIFGCYGIFNLFKKFPTLEASVYLLKVIVILYPAFTIFAVIHSYFLQSQAEGFSASQSIVKGGIWQQRR